MELSTLPIAFFAGIVGIVSPCVWPLLPIVMSSAGKKWSSKLLLALGLATAFSLAGGILTWVMINLNLNPIAYRALSAYLLVFIGLILVSNKLSNLVSNFLSRFTANIDTLNSKLELWMGPFGLGMLLGFVWLPCVGPTLGAAIALASQGQNLFVASLVLASFGLGTALALIVAASGLSAILKQTAPNALNSMLSNGKRFLGFLLLGLGILVITGFDLRLEAMVVPYLPTWSQI